jgi:hypothetical protein
MTGSEPTCSPTAHQQTDVIRDLNDRFRASFEGGKVLVTQGIQSLGPAATLVILQAVAHFKHFTQANHPHNEHDFGGFEYGDLTVFWKIDYYDEQLELASPDPSDPNVTTRVLTIMLASEY